VSKAPNFPARKLTWIDGSNNFGTGLLKSFLLALGYGRSDQVPL